MQCRSAFPGSGLRKEISWIKVKTAYGVLIKKQRKEENEYEKNHTALLLALCLVGCSSPAPTTAGSEELASLRAQIEELKNENEQLKRQLESGDETTIAESAESDDGNLPVNIGDVITTDNMEITINKVELTYDVLPDDTSGFYTHYEAEPGNVYLHLDLDIKNLGKQNLPCDSILSATADYNSGYTYMGSAVPEDSTTGFTYANITSIKPLQTLGVHYIFECPQEVDENENPLLITIEPQNTNSSYVLTIR